MGKLFKIIGIFIGAVLLLIVAASIILPMVISPNDFKGEIVKRVQQQTGRELKIDGDLSLSVFPWLGINIEDVALSNAKGFGAQPFVSIKRATVRVKLMPLLNSKLEVDTVGLGGMTLNLARNRDGKNNWDDLAEGKESKPSAGEEKGGDSSSTGFDTFSIGGVDISNANISWDDRQSGQKYEISEFNLKSGAIASGRPVALNMGMVLQSIDPALKARIGLDGTVNLDEAKGELNIADLKLTLDANGAALPNGTLTAKLETGVRLALNGSSLALQNLNLSSGILNLVGNLQGANLNSETPVFNGKFSLAEFSLRDWMASQGMALPDSKDPKAFGRFAASLNLTAKGQSTNLDNLNIQLDDSKITGNAVMRGEATTFKLNVDAIDLDRYMATGKAGGAQAVSGNSGSKSGSGGEQLFPMETMRRLDLNGSLQIGRLTTNKLLAENVAVTLVAKGGLLQTTQKVGRFYQGTYNGSADLNVKGNTPQLNINSALSNVSLAPLVKQLAGEDRLNGQGNFNANMSASGNSEAAFRRSLNGKMNFELLHGAIKGINLAEELRKAKALFSGKSYTASKEPVQTDFSQITGSGVIKNGVLSNNDLQALSPFLRVTGEGAINLVSEMLDYTATVFIVETSQGQGGRDLAALEELKRHKIGVPVRFKGPLTSPKWQVKWDKVLLDTQKEKLKSALEEKLLGDEKKKDGEEESDKDKLKRKLLKKLIR